MVGAANVTEINLIFEIIIDIGSGDAHRQYRAERDDAFLDTDHGQVTVGAAGVENVRDHEIVTDHQILITITRKVGP